MIKLIVSDVDGTLLSHAREISRENCEAVAMAQQRDIRFAIASGRMYADIRILLEHYGLSCECLSMNGAEYYDARGNCLEGCYFSADKAREVQSVLAGMPEISAEIYGNDGCYTTQSRWKTFRGMMRRGKTFYPSRGLLRDVLFALNNQHFRKMRYIRDFDVFLQSGTKIAKFISFGRSEQEIDKMRGLLDGVSGVAISSSFRLNLEINAGDASKGNILKRLIAREGIREDEVMVIGDGLNDLSMFEAFPTNSVAMGNAIPRLKEIAAHVAPDCDHSGVAKAIRSYALGMEVAG